jgi:hypothetical protein
MADRKSLQKYYPVDFDPSLLTRNRSLPSKPTKVNFMCPFRSMRCLSCGHYTTRGTTFRNSPKYISPDTYLGVKIVRLHCKCPSRRSEIILEPDPKNMNYRIVSGAKREYEVWRDDERVKETTEQRLDRLEREEEEVERQREEAVTIEGLERRIDDARMEMKVADALDEIRAANAWRLYIEALPLQRATSEEQDAKDTEIARAAITGRKRSATECSVGISEFNVSRPVKRVKNDFAKALDIKRKSYA